MDSRGTESLLQAIRRLAGSQAASDRSERELLTRFVRDRDEGAFAALVRRHGAMVLATCRRVLRQSEDVEDAFQATFLVLVRKAAVIRRRESLAGWLHGVAYRVASNLRRGATRRRAHEARTASPTATTAAADVGWREVRAMLDEEMRRLPERYRLPLVLCYLEGKTRDEAARQLGWSTGAVRARLARGRGLLRARLTRRGLTLGAAPVALALARDAAAVPPALVLSTTRLAAAYAAGTAAPGQASAAVVVLAEEASKAMTTGTWKLAAAVLLAVAASGAGLGVLVQQGRQPGEADRTGAPAPVARAPGGDPHGEEPLRQEVDRLRQENAQLRKEVLELKRRLAAPAAKPEAPPAPEARYKGKPAAYWVEALKDKDAAFATEAVKALALIGDPKTVPALVEALKDPWLEAEVAGSLAVFGEAARPAVPGLIRVLENTRDWRARGSAALTLFAIAPADALPPFSRMLKDRDAKRRLLAAEALGGCGQAAVPLLVEALRKDPDKWVRRAAAVSLGEIGQKHGKEAPYVKVSLAPTSVRSCRAPANLGASAREAVPALIEALHDTDPAASADAFGLTLDVRSEAVRTLGKLGPDARPALAALTRLAEDKREREQDRLNAAAAVWKIDPVAAAQARLPVLDVLGKVSNYQPQLREEVKEEVKEAVPALAAALTARDPEVRAAVADALGRIGADAASAAPALRRALRDEDAQVRAAAERALGRVARRGAGEKQAK